MNRLNPTEAMQMAIEEGKKGAGFVSPNPLVGCVLLDREFRFLSKGYHAKLGDLHAETAALRQVEDPARLEGAHVYVTLEPCAHEGRQPSCAKTLARLPIASVTYGLQDPNPRVAGQGAEILRQAGKRVELFAGLHAELEELAEIFLLNMRQGRTFVAAKVASSLDGQIALTDGQSQWITDEAARARVQYLRGCYDALLTGAGTILADNPRLNSRDERFKSRRQRLVILDRDGELLSKIQNLEVLRVREKDDVWILTRPDVGSAPEGIRHITMEVSGQEFDLRKVLAELRRQDIHSVMIEAGASLVGSFLRQNLMDRLFLFMAPKILGQGLSWTSGLRIDSLDRAIGLEDLKVESLGPDYLLSGRPRFP